MKDIYQVNDVEVMVDYSGKLWINVDGICLMRIGHAKKIIFENSGKQTVAHEDKSVQHNGNASFSQEL